MHGPLLWTITGIGTHGILNPFALVHKMIWLYYHLNYLQGICCQQAPDILPWMSCGPAPSCLKHGPTPSGIPAKVKSFVLGFFFPGLTHSGHSAFSKELKIAKRGCVAHSALVEHQSFCTLIDW